jgi:hypothetical protein
MTQLAYKRGRRKVIANYKFGEIYEFYKERYGDSALPRKVVYKIYKKLFPTIVKLMVFENLDFRMPSRLGYLRVRKRLVEPRIDKDGNLDASKLSIDWKKTKKLWLKLYPDKTAEEIKKVKDKPLIRETNDSTNGYRLCWFWDKTTCNLKNQSAYYVDLTRDNDQILSRGAKMNNLNFYE